MARYVDGFIVPVPKKKIEAYRQMSRKVGRIWREYGALEYCECVADDVKPGKVTSFPQSVKRIRGARRAKRTGRGGIDARLSSRAACAHVRAR
jgi:hypothetical protein